MMGLRYLQDVVTLRLETEKCGGCGQCLDVCPHKVFRMEAGKAEIWDKDACMECGACAKNCSFGAISVRSGVGCAAALLFSDGEPSCGKGSGCNCG